MSKRLVLTVALISAITTGLLIYGGVAAFTSRQKPAANTDTVQYPEFHNSDTSPAVYHDPALITALESVGYKDKDLSEITLRFAEPSEVHKECQWEKAGACYDAGKKTILVSSTREGDELRRSISHEYLHYMWDKHNLNDDQALKDVQRIIYDSNKNVENRIHEFYSGMTSDIDTELFSYLCTEFKNQVRDNYVGRNCNVYIDIELLPTKY